MMFRRSALAAVFTTLPFAALAQTTAEATGGLRLELNTVQTVEAACRLTFVAQNATGTAIDDVSFETVIFDRSGGVVTLALYNFGDLPAGLPRVRRFLVSELGCDKIGRVLINGVNTCVAGGSDSGICAETLILHSRTDVELLG